METKITLKDPADLAIHPLAKRLPDWSKEDPRFEALVLGVAEAGITAPLLIDSQGRIVKGRKYWRAAKQLQLVEVPCITVNDEDIATVILNGLVHRSHYTKSQLAFVAFPLLEPALAESKARRSKNLKNGNFSPNRHSVTIRADTAEELASQYGFGLTLLKYARQIHDHFKNPKKFEWNDEPDQELTIAEYYEPRILADEDPHGLGAVLAGIASKLSGNVTNQHRGDQLYLFEAGLDTFKNRFAYWSEFNDQEQLKARLKLRSVVAAMDEALLEEFEKAIKLARKHSEAAA